MSSSQQDLTSHPVAMPWILQACQEYEKWAQDWFEHVGRLSVQNNQLKRSVRELESEKRHIDECRDMQGQMIDTQKDLINSLKNDLAEDRGGSLAPGNTLRIDPTLSLGSPETSAAMFEPPSCTSETYSARLLMALAESASTEAE